MQARVNAPFSTSVAIRGIPADGVPPSAASRRDQNKRRHPKGNPPSLVLRRRRPSRWWRRDTTARGAREQKQGARDTNFSTKPE